MSTVDDEHLEAVPPVEGSAPPYPQTCLHHLFEAHADRSPDAPAVAFGDEVLSYEEVEGAAANRLARTLREAGIAREDRVAVYLTRRAEWVVAIVGILKAGAAYVPIDPEYPEDRVTFMIEDSGATIVVTEECLHQHVPSSIVAVDLDGLLEARASDNDSASLCPLIPLILPT